MEEQKEKIEVRLTRDRIEEMVTVDEFIAISEDKSLRVTKAVVARFVIDPATGTWMEEKAAQAYIGKMSIGQLTELLGAFNGTMEKAVVPLPNSKTST